MTYQYDLLVIGSGSAGFAAAAAAKGPGRRIGMIEAAELGGECPNWACVPTKTLLKSAQLYRELQHASGYGVLADRVRLDVGRVQERRAQIVEQLGGERVARVAEDLGIDVLHGHAVFLDPHTVDVDGTSYTAARFIIATGSTTFVPPIPGIDRTPWMSFKEAVTLNRAPESLCIIGGGPVGCELASYFAVVGTRVTLLQSAGQLLEREEPEIGRLIADEFGKLGVEVQTQVDVLETRVSGTGVAIRYQRQGQLQECTAQQLLLATGKASATAGLGTRAAGLELDPRGRLVTNKALRTNVEHIWAAGDVNGGLQFTHMAHYEGHLAGWNAFAKKPAMVNDRVVPRVTFVTPEVASVGMTEAEARKEKGNVRVGVAQIAQLGRALIEGQTVGLVKLVADRKTGKLLGGHICAPRAGEMIHEVALALSLHATAEDLANLIHAYPTYSEALVAAAVPLLD